MDYSGELEQLRQESELPLEQLLASLPPEIIEGKSLSSEGVAEEEEMEAEGEGQEVVEEEKTPRRSLKKRRYLCVWF